MRFCGFTIGNWRFDRNNEREINDDIRYNPRATRALGAGLGYLYGALERDRSKVNEVTLKEGTELGVRLASLLTVALSH